MDIFRICAIMSLRNIFGFSLVLILLTELASADGYIDLHNLPTYQRGVWIENGVALNSSRAVDLDFETCAQSIDPNNANGQWYIDLVKNYTINSVTVFNNNIGSPQYLSYFNITVGSTTDVNSQTLCHNYNQSVPAGENATITCNVPSVGRYLSITRYGSDNPKSLYLCEIYIKGQIFLESSLSTSTTVKTSSSTTTSSVSRSTTSTTTTSTYHTPIINSSTTTAIIIATSATNQLGFSSAFHSPSSDSSVSTSQQNVNLSNEFKDRVAGLTAAVIVLGIIFALSLVAIVFLIVYILRQKSAQTIQTSVTTNSSVDAAPNYERLRFDTQSPSGSKDNDSNHIQRSQNVGDPTYEQVELNTKSTPNVM